MQFPFWLLNRIHIKKTSIFQNYMMVLLNYPPDPPLPSSIFKFVYKGAIELTGFRLLA